jgi:endonuclease YncB( thermonuclease family)
VLLLAATAPAGTAFAQAFPDIFGSATPETGEKGSPGLRKKPLSESNPRPTPETRGKPGPDPRSKARRETPPKEQPPEERTVAIDRENLAVIDGDSVLIDGREWRLLGFDAPEFVEAKCEGEHRAGIFARRRLVELVAAAKRIEMRFWGKVDNKNRAFGELLLDGRNVGSTMIADGYARPYDGGEIKSWCAPGVRHDLLPDVEPRQ